MRSYLKQIVIDGEKYAPQKNDIRFVPKTRKKETDMRIDKHPVLGDETNIEWVNITVDGRPIKAKKGEMILAALHAEDIIVNRYTAKKHEPRGIFCGIGQCTDCMMVVNGIPNIRTCITPVEEGMTVETQDGLGTWRGDKQ